MVGISSGTFGCGYVTGSGPSSPPSPLLVAPAHLIFIKQRLEIFFFYPLQICHQILHLVCMLCRHPIYQYPAK